MVKRYTIEKDRLDLKGHGVRLPYSFEKEMEFVDPCTLPVRYRVTNFASAPMDAIWAAHPLFAVSPGMEIFFPAGITFDSDLGDWKAEVDSGLKWVTIGAHEAHIAKKFFTRKLAQGWGGIYDEKSGKDTCFIFSRQKNNLSRAVHQSRHCAIVGCKKL